MREVDGRSWRDRWLARLAPVFWPPRCLACEAPGVHGLDLCGECLAALPRNLHACPGCALPVPDPAAAMSATTLSPGAAAALPATAPATRTAAEAIAATPDAAVFAAPAPSPVDGVAATRTATAATRCGTCLRRPLPFGLVVAPYLYAPPLDRLLPGLKFHGDLAAGRLLAQLMAAALAGVPRPQALVPVPLHPQRLRQRGYDQARELATPLAKALRLPLRTDLLRRVRATQAQSDLDGAARRLNLRGAFAVSAGPLPAWVVLVDDVMTTGATLTEAAVTLRRAGVARVDAWACARVP